MIRLPVRALERIRREAAVRYPEECCGALLGWDDSGNGRLVDRAIPGANERSEERARRFLLGPDAIRRFEREADATGLTVVGYFHSHPDAPATPSEFDRRHAWPWYSYLIVPVEDAAAGRARSWRLRSDRSGFDEEVVVPTESITRTRDAGA